MALQSDNSTEIEHVTEEIMEVQEPQLVAMMEEMLLKNWALSDIAESELWEAHQWSDATRDDVCPEDKSEEMLSALPVVTQTSESTVSNDVQSQVAKQSILCII